jgi:hypothetical protein
MSIVVASLSALLPPARHIRIRPHSWTTLVICERSSSHVQCISSMIGPGISLTYRHP